MKKIEGAIYYLVDYLLYYNQISTKVFLSEISKFMYEKL